MLEISKVLRTKGQKVMHLSTPLALLGIILRKAFANVGAKRIICKYSRDEYFTVFSSGREDALENVHMLCYSTRGAMERILEVESFVSTRLHFSTQIS